MVGHRDVQPVVFDARLHDDLAIGGRVLRRVLEHVRQRDRRETRIDLRFRSASASTRSACPSRACRTWQLAASTTSAGVTHCRSTWIAAASMRAMSRMSWNRRVSRSSSTTAASACVPPLVGRQLASQVFDRDANRRQRRLQIVAQRRQQRRRQIGLLPHQFRGVTFRQELRAFDRDRHHAGQRVQRADVQRRRDRGQQTDGFRPVSQRHDEYAVAHPRCAHGRRRRAGAHRTPTCRAPWRGPCSTYRRRRRRPRCPP